MYIEGSLPVSVVKACARQLPDPNQWKGGRECLILLPAEPMVVQPEEYATHMHSPRAMTFTLQWYYDWPQDRRTYYWVPKHRPTEY